MLRLLPIAVFLLAGCGSLSRSAPEVRAFVLQAERPEAPAAAAPSESPVEAATGEPATVEPATGEPATGELATGSAAGGFAPFDTLEVRRLRISPRYDTRSFVYRTSEHGFESDFYNEFFASPADLVTQETQRWLDRSGLFKHVVGPESRVLGGLVLEGNLVALYGDYASSPRRAVLELQFLLVSEPGSAVVDTFSTRVETPIEGPRGGGGAADRLVDAWCQALAQALGELEERLRSRNTSR